MCLINKVSPPALMTKPMVRAMVFMDISLCLPVSRRVPARPDDEGRAVVRARASIVGASTRMSSLAVLIASIGQQRRGLDPLVPTGARLRCVRHVLTSWFNWHSRCMPAPAAPAP